MQSEQRKRPTGVTIIAILSIIGGIFAIIAGAAVTVLIPIFVSQDFGMSGVTIDDAGITTAPDGDRTSVIIVDNSDGQTGGIVTEGSSATNDDQFLSFVDEAAPFLVALGFIMLGLGVFSLVVAYGLLRGLHWAWIATLVLSLASIAIAFISMYTSSNPGNFVNIIISGIIIYYLYRPHVKRYFGKTSPPSLNDNVAPK